MVMDPFRLYPQDRACGGLANKEVMTVVMRGVMMAVRSPGAEELHVDGSCSVPPPRLPPAPRPGPVLY